MEIAIALLLLAAGAYFTIRTRFVQVRRFFASLAAFFRMEKGDDGRNVSPFEAAATALAATIGTGNIGGVAGALLTGGPGAVFWMWISALLGMALKYAEILFAVRFRQKGPDGWYGGPMFYIERGLSKRWHFLAPAFALCGALAALGMGNLAQVNTVAESAITLFGALTGGVSAAGVSRISFAVGITVAGMIAVAVLGGSKRVGRVAALLVPLMSVLYIGGALLVVFGRPEQILPSLQMIVRSAFKPQAALGGAIGISLRETLRIGVSRGVFTHEAGLGTSAIAHAAADAKTPQKQALYGIFEIFLDTIVMCTLTALAILVSGVTLDYGNNAVAGSLVSHAFATRFGDTGASLFLSLSLLLFAFTSMLSFSLYGSQCAAYLFGRRAIKPYLFLFVALCVFGAMMPLALAWRISELLNMLMAVPNLIALFLLSRRHAIE